MSDLFEDFRNILKESSTPVVVCESKGQLEYFSAANIYTSVMDRMRQFKRLGAKKGSVLSCPVDPMNIIVDFLACLKLGVTYFLRNSDSYELVDFSKNQELSNIVMIIDTNHTQYFSEYSVNKQIMDICKDLEQIDHEHILTILNENNLSDFVFTYLAAISLNKYVSTINKKDLDESRLNLLLEDDIDLIFLDNETFELLNIINNHKLKTLSFYSTKDLDHSVSVVNDKDNTHSEIKKIDNEIFRSIVIK